MKNSEIKKLSPSEIKTQILAQKEIVSKLKFSHAISPIENTSSIRKAKKAVARLLTEATKKDIK
ncbi:MAG: 50S ribosomal protein L29 [Cytophagales bacterium]|nr:MAG: 50S ribosomal protein L29 [Cytophagales bacterium]